MAIPRNLSNLASGADTNGVLQPSKGGTGATSTAAAPFAQKGANSDITSLSGLTTALSPAQGGTGLTSPGANGNVLTSNGTAWVSSAAAGGGSITATASGSITAGQGVIVNNDGTVSVPSLTLTTTATAASTVAASNSQDNGAMVWNSAIQRYVVVYRNNNGSTSASVGALNPNNTVTWTTPTVVYTGSDASFVTAVYHEAQQRVVVFVRTNTGQTLGFGLNTTSNSVSVAFSSPNQYQTQTSIRPYAIYDPVRQTIILLTYRPSFDAITLSAVTVTSNSLTFGTQQSVSGTLWNSAQLYYYPNSDRILIFWSDSGPNLFCNSYTFDGTNFSNVAQTTVRSNAFPPFNYMGFAHSSVDNQAVMAYGFGSSQNGIGINVLTVSGSTISVSGLGSVSVDYQPSNLQLVYDSFTNRFVLFYRQSSSSNFLACRVGTLSGGSISFGAETVVANSNTNESGMTAVYNPTNNVSTVSTNLSNSSRASWSVTTGSSTLNANRFVGVAANTVTNGQTATITTVGAVNTNVSGLVAGTKYYVSPTGSLQTTNNGVFAGTALSSTRLAVNNPTLGLLDLYTSAGDLLIGVSQGNVTRLPVGGNGQVLSSNGTVPQWQTPSQPGWVFLSSTAVTSTTNVDMNNIFDSTYDMYAVIGTNLLPSSTTNFAINLFFYTTGGTLITSGYSNAVNTTQSQSSSYQGTGSSSAVIMNNGNVSTQQPFNFVMFVPNPSAASIHKNVFWTGSMGLFTASGFGSNSTTTALTGFRFSYGNTFAASGVIRVYGIRNS